MKRDQSISSNDIHFLGVVLKLGLAIVIGGWFFGTWWICCSNHVIMGSHHQVFKDHEILESLRGNAVQLTRELNENQIKHNVIIPLRHEEIPLKELHQKEIKILNSVVKQEVESIPEKKVSYNFNPPWSVNKTMEGTIFMSIAACK